MHYTYKKHLDGWRWRFYGGNQKIVASGEAYHNEADCLHAIQLLKGSSNAPVKKE